METGNRTTQNGPEIIFQDRGFTNDEVQPEQDHNNEKKHALVVSLFSMLQRPSSSVIIPSFGERDI